MSNVTVEWTIRAGNRDAGDRETVERTAYVDALIAAGRVVVIEEEAPLDAVKATPVPTPEEAMTEGLVLPMVKPGPRGPRARPMRSE